MKIEYLTERYKPSLCEKEHIVVKNALGVYEYMSRQYYKKYNHSGWIKKGSQEECKVFCDSLNNNILKNKHL